MTTFRIAIITQEDPFSTTHFFREFLKILSKDVSIAVVAIAPPMGKRSLYALARQMFHFYGPIDFLRMGLRFVALKLLDRLPGSILGPYSVAATCRRHGVDYRHVSDVNHENFISSLKQAHVDLIVSVAAPQIFRQPLMDAARLGCINIHNSKLPKYRGMLPNFWQMLNREQSVWTSVHRINSKIDDGEILLQRESCIVEGESLHELIVRTKRIGAHVMLDAIMGMRDGTLTPQKNMSEDATYFNFPTPEHVREFRRRGLRLV